MECIGFNLKWHKKTLGQVEKEKKKEKKKNNKKSRTKKIISFFRKWKKKRAEKKSASPTLPCPLEFEGPPPPKVSWGPGSSEKKKKKKKSKKTKLEEEPEILSMPPRSRAYLPSLNGTHYYYVMHLDISTFIFLYSFSMLFFFQLIMPVCLTWSLICHLTCLE